MRTSPRATNACICSSVLLNVALYRFPPFVFVPLLHMVSPVMPPLVATYVAPTCPIVPTRLDMLMMLPLTCRRWGSANLQAAK